MSGGNGRVGISTKLAGKVVPAKRSYRVEPLCRIGAVTHIGSTDGDDVLAVFDRVAVFQSRLDMLQAGRVGSDGSRPWDSFLARSVKATQHGHGCRRSRLIRSVFLLI